MESLLLQGLYKIYKEGDIETVALRDAGLAVQPGEFVAITGRSGAGKSTLLNLVGGLSTPSAGKVIIHGTDITRLGESERAAFRRKKIGIVYQTDNLIPFLTALENVMLPMQLAGRKDSRERARRLLGEVGLSERFKHKPNMLSGGERQRVAIAVALANEPELLLADEPTGNVDPGLARRLLRLFVELHKSGTSIVIATHDLGLMDQFESARRLVLGEGRLHIYD
jgi:cell division transport system ATP-binding protein